MLSKQNMKETLIQLSLVQMISRPFGISVASIPINEILFLSLDSGVNSVCVITRAGCRSLEGVEKTSPRRARR